MEHKEDETAEREFGTQVAIRPEFGQGERERLRAYLVIMAGQNVGEMFRVSAKMVVGRSRDCDIRIIDDGVSRKHAQIVVSKDEVYVEDLKSTNGTFVNGETIDRHQLCDGDKIEVGSSTIVKFTFHDQLEAQFQQNMFEAALRDGLTKTFNKRYFTDRVTTECAFSLRHKSSLGLLLFDIDKFKQINDTYGHLAGDYVIAELARRVSAETRREDVLARYGGEEFALLCRGLDLSHTQQVAERLRAVVEADAFLYEGRAIPVTISVGVAHMPDAAIHSSKDLIATADDALYRAKETGRNRVVYLRAKAG